MARMTGLKGIKSTTVGYTGGSNPAPSYDSVCNGDGHTEAVKIEYDPSVTSYDELLDMFWRMYNGSSSMPQYKTAIWYHNDKQRQDIQKSIEAAKAKMGQAPWVEVLPAEAWHDAEWYHQKNRFKVGAAAAAWAAVLLR
eukprot:gnl/TRDRNA2_/TRDRNA2_142564_c4_seq1.p2 gnl/TRDRNA2_/TRDRNA2_142564_c4~~gnl/TRDRNA2_/TRDRNA2_142564_c4_seq1.p2  ORF type:complete len:139 (+),score=27.96 gnl/TRDRNA2_/TRDRNA2_142564_c4_seq1:476-892(+)